jgi:two-component system nitrate/nitrite response regulator NarL
MTADHSSVNTLKVVIFVRNVVMRRGLEAILHQLPLISSVHHCDHEDEAGKLITDGDVDVLIVTMGENAVAEELAHAGTGTKVLVLLDETEAISASSTATLTADGFLIQQELTASDLHEALDRIVAGEMPMPARLGRQLIARASSLVGGDLSRPVTLTPRENETLELLTEGLSNKQIARRLSISDHGAKRLVTSVMLKLGAPNRTAAVVTAIRIGMISNRGGEGVGARS